MALRREWLVDIARNGYCRSNEARAMATRLLELEAAPSEASGYYIVNPTSPLSPGVPDLYFSVLTGGLVTEKSRGTAFFSYQLAETVRSHVFGGSNSTHVVYSGAT